MSDQKFGEEIFSQKIEARNRTIFVDLKKNSNGKFLKVSERLKNGNRNTIMVGEEEMPDFVDAILKSSKY